MSTVENSENAKAGNLIISLPFLEDNLPADQQIVDLDSHPVTGSNVRLALFDIFLTKATRTIITKCYVKLAA